MTTTFRQLALDAIKRGRSGTPSWGEERISNMIATRPDWCISRQRIWGVPYRGFSLSRNVGLASERSQPSIKQHRRALQAKESADAWYIHAAASLAARKHNAVLPAATMNFAKRWIFVDVWFESGASWHAVLDAEPELHLARRSLH